MAVAVRIVLAFGLLLAHTPLCKVAALSPRTPADSPRTSDPLPCCAKCAKKPDASHTKPTAPRPPAKPACPAGSSALCSAPAAVVPEAAGVTDIAAPLVAELAEGARVLTTAGFYSLLDRPPRG